MPDQNNRLKAGSGRAIRATHHSSPSLQDPKVRYVMGRPGELVTIKLDCERCEDRRWPAVNPIRNVLRGWRRFEDGDIEGARNYFDLALEQLRYFAQHTDEQPRPEDRTEALDRAETTLRMVEALLPVRGSKHARGAITDYFGEST